MTSILPVFDQQMGEFGEGGRWKAEQLGGSGGNQESLPVLVEFGVGLARARVFCTLVKLFGASASVQRVKPGWLRLSITESKVGSRWDKRAFVIL